MLKFHWGHPDKWNWIYVRWIYHATLCICRHHVSVSVCVCLFLCLSVTLRYCIKTAECRIMQIMPHNSPRTLVFWCKRSRLASSVTWVLLTLPTCRVRFLHAIRLNFRAGRRGFACVLFHARCNLHILRLCYDVSVRLSVCLWWKWIGT